MRDGKKWMENKTIVLLLITGAVYFFLRFISPLFTPVMLAGIFLTLCYPTFDDIQKKTRIKKQYLASAILLLICAALIVLVWFCGSLLLKQVPAWVEDIDLLQENLRVVVRQGCENVGNLFGIDTENLSSALIEQMDIFMENFQAQALPDVLGESWGYILHLISVIAVLAVTMIATVLLAKDYDAILSKVGAHRESRMILEIALRVIRYLATFVKAQFLIMLIIATICVLLLSLGRVANGWIFGLVAGALDALPFIGTGVVLVPLALWQLIQGYFGKALLCLGIYVACALVRQFMEPKLIGKEAGFYPVVILIAVYAGLKLFGVAGIIKGPVGLVMIKQAYEAYRRQVDDGKQKDYDENKIPGGRIREHSE
ncbi:MAG: AI-2E family transporter [Lachnospiraceae bacterium]|nr:AI-2E family transporter [Lachnospiraceae bacterium]